MARTIIIKKTHFLCSWSSHFRRGLICWQMLEESVMENTCRLSPDSRFDKLKITFSFQLTYSLQSYSNELSKQVKIYHITLKSCPADILNKVERANFLWKIYIQHFSFQLDKILDAQEPQSRLHSGGNHIWQSMHCNGN